MKKDLLQLHQEFIYECKYLKNNSKETIRGLKNTFDLFMKLTGVLKAEDLTSETIRQFFQILQERERVVGKGIIKTGVKPSTIITYWTKLNVFFNWLKKGKHISINSFSEVARPRLTYEDRKFLSKGEVEKIITSLYLHNLNDPLVFKRNILLFHIFLFCGLRKGEVLGLQIDDIDIENRLLKVRGETSKSRRTRLIPLHPTIIIHIRDYLRERKNYKTQYLLVSRIRDDS